MKKQQIAKVISAIGILAATSGAAYAQGGGCVDSPENPTAVLALLGAASAGVPWLRAKWLARRRPPGVSGRQGG